MSALDGIDISESGSFFFCSQGKHIILYDPFESDDLNFMFRRIRRGQGSDYIHARPTVPKEYI